MNSYEGAGQVDPAGLVLMVAWNADEGVAHASIEDRRDNPEWVAAIGREQMDRDYAETLPLAQRIDGRRFGTAADLRHYLVDIVGLDRYDF